MKRKSDRLNNSISEIWSSTKHGMFKVLDQVIKWCYSMFAFIYIYP